MKIYSRLFCVRCGENFRTDDSIGSNSGLCQGCWEAECDRGWWDMIDTFGAAQTLAERLLDPND